MAFDAHKNFAIATVATAPSPATSGTSLVVAFGQGAIFPAVPFNATVWPTGTMPTPSTAEVVRVTAKSTDTFTITRAQESSTARAIVTGDLIAATITVKTITDLEAGTNFPLITTGAINATTLSSTGALVTSTGAIQSTYQATNAAGTSYFGVDGYPTPVYLGPPGVTFMFASPSAGMTLFCGHASGIIRLCTGGSVTPKWTVRADGGFSAGTEAAGQEYVVLSQAGVQLRLGTYINGYTHVTFSNNSGQVGSITTGGSSTAYGTTSDARLKRDRGAHADLDVLRRTVVHAFDWLTDGTPGRGVFAQEAATVAPFAVTVGTDARDAEGRLTSPWGVDYSKYVPDLLAGWQAHEAQITALEDRCAALEARLAALTLPPAKD